MRQPWGVIILVSTVIVLYYSGILQPIANRIVHVIQVPQQWLYNATRSWRNTDTASFDELMNSNTLLEQRVRELVTENTQLKTVIEQSTLLEEQIAFLQEKKFAALQAVITSTTADGLTTQYVMNRGTDHGVSIGQAVIVDNGILVGVITEAESTFSRMMPITSTQLSVGAQLQNQQRSPGIITGEHELSLRMSYVPQFDSIAPRSIVVTSGIDPHIPVGLVIGEVTEVLKEPGALFQQVVVMPYAEPNQLSVVSIIIQ